MSAKRSVLISSPPHAFSDFSPGGSGERNILLSVVDFWANRHSSAMLYYKARSVKADSQWMARPRRRRSDKK
jgi:hypothetical protein